MSDQGYLLPSNDDVDVVFFRVGPVGCPPKSTSSDPQSPSSIGSSGIPPLSPPAFFSTAKVSFFLPFFFLSPFFLWVLWESMGAGAVEGTTYWLQWQVPLCALVFLVPAAVAAVVLYRLRKAVHLRASDLWLPCWRPVRPGWLLGYRTVVLVVMSYVLYKMALRHGASVVYFYTQWTFSLVIVYFALGTLMSAYGCWTSSKQTTSIIEERYKFLKRDPDVEGIPSAATSSLSNGVTKLQSYQELDEDQQKAGFWGNTMQIVYQTSGGAVILTDVVFWGLIVPFLSNEHFKLNLLMGCMHSLNLLFLLFDTALNSLPFPWFGMAYFVLWSCTYVIFQWVLHACGFTWWPYPFLKLDTPWAPLWYVCMALVHIPCYAFYTLAVKAKNSLFSKWFPNTYIRSS